MSKSMLNKLKEGAKNCASTVLLHIDLAAEESRLKSKYESLGEHFMKALQNNDLDSLQEDPRVVELVGAIQENKARIRSLKEQSRKKSCKCESCEKD